VQRSRRLSEEPTNEKTKKRSRVKTVSPIRGTKIPQHIVMKFCLMLGLPDIVFHAKLGDDRLSYFCMVSGRILDFPIDFGCRPYNTPALPCRNVISRR